MEVYVVIDSAYLDDLDSIEAENSLTPALVSWLDDSVSLYVDLETLMTDYGVEASEDGFTEKQLIKDLYDNHNLIIVKKHIYSMESTFGTFKQSTISTKTIPILPWRST